MSCSRRLAVESRRCGQLATIPRPATRLEGADFPQMRRRSCRTPGGVAPPTERRACVSMHRLATQERGPSIPWTQGRCEHREANGSRGARCLRASAFREPQLRPRPKRHPISRPVSWEPSLGVGDHNLFGSRRPRSPPPGLPPHGFFPQFGVRHEVPAGMRRQWLRLRAATDVSARATCTVSLAYGPRAGDAVSMVHPSLASHERSRTRRDQQRDPHMSAALPLLRIVRPCSPQPPQSAAFPKALPESGSSRSEVAISTSPCWRAAPPP